MSSARLKCGLFHAVNGAAQGFVGAVVYNVIANTFGYTPMGKSAAVMTLALGKFLYGCIIADENGNDPIQEQFKLSTAMAISKMQEESVWSTLSTMESNGFTSGVNNFRSHHQNIQNSVAKQKFIYSLIEGSVAGTLGYTAMLVLGGSGLSFKEMLIDVATSSATTATLKGYAMNKLTG